MKNHSSHTFENHAEENYAEKRLFQRLPKDVFAAIKVLDEVKDFTLTLREKLLFELKHSDPIHLNLDQI